MCYSYIHSIKGQTVEWCFCSGHSQADDSEPCNAISRKSMGGGLISYNSDLDEEDAEEYEGQGHFSMNNWDIIVIWHHSIVII